MKLEIKHSGSWHVYENLDTGEVFRIMSMEGINSILIPESDDGNVLITKSYTSRSGYYTTIVNFKKELGQMEAARWFSTDFSHANSRGIYKSNVYCHPVLGSSRLIPNKHIDTGDNIGL